MKPDRRAYSGAALFDGVMLLRDEAIVVAEGKVEAICSPSDVAPDVDVVSLDGGLLCPGFVDLQVNGGGGVMFNDAPNSDGLRTMVAAHARLGATSILPTLITDTPETTHAAIEAVATGGVPGMVGLHLEGPHIAVEKKGAHSAPLIRPMEASDLALYLDAASRVPRLKITLAPEAVTPKQISALADAGVLVALGHSNAIHEECAAAIAAGATLVTHLFNAMSPLTSRAPGLVGAALDHGAISAGLIADGIHVHPATVRTALRAKAAQGTIHLVSDAMGVAGTDEGYFVLNGRNVHRRDGRLTLEDGTLAGADLDLLSAVRNLVAWKAATVPEALAMATAVPGGLLGGQLGRLVPGAPADMVHVSEDLSEIRNVWRAGSLIA